MLDTSVAIHLRDGDPDVGERVRAATETLAFSMITLVELEAGFLDGQADIRRERLSALLEGIVVRPFDRRDAETYDRIISASGFSRRKVLDRMIAAQALVDGAALVTLNGDDFRDIPGLKLIEW